MEKIAFTIIILFLVYGTALPQSYLPEGIEFTTQEQIDNFQTNNPGCTEIEGNIIILGNDITNLNGLSVATSIGGDINISGNEKGMTSSAGGCHPFYGLYVKLNYSGSKIKKSI